MSPSVLDLCPSLRLDPDSGLWRGGEAGPLSYPEEDNDACFRVEDGSFWFAHRNRCITAAVRRFPPPGLVLDVGGGNGYVARGLLDAGFDTALLEPGPRGAANARHGRGLPTVICSTLEGAGFRPGSLPAAGMFDVLEHLQDDLGFLRRLREVLQPAGMLYLTVPAFGWLWSMSDVDAMHFRRYSPSSLAAVLREAGFEPLYATCLFQRLVPFFFLKRRLPYLLGLARPQPASAYEAQHDAGGSWLSRLFERLIEGEVGAIERGSSLRLGSSLLMVARRN